MFPIGTRVRLLDVALHIPYIATRKHYTNMYEGKSGTVIGYSSTGKVAIEFDDIVFTSHTTRLSSHDNGCHGKGKLHYCWYIPEFAIELEVNNLILLLT